MANKKHSLAGSWIDCSRALEPSIAVWPGDRKFEVIQSKNPDFVLSSFSTTCHIGTHVDAPLHIDGSREGVEGIPLERLSIEVDIAGTRYTGTITTKAAFNPDGKRMR